MTPAQLSHLKAAARAEAVAEYTARLRVRLGLAEAFGYTLYAEQRGEHLLQYCASPGEKMPWERFQSCAQEEEKKRYRVLAWSDFNSNQWDGRLPDWDSDPAAVHELRGKLSPKQGLRMVEELIRILNDANRASPTWVGPTMWDCLNATPLQQSEAILRALRG